MYGHVESCEELAEHLVTIRGIQLAADGGDGDIKDRADENNKRGHFTEFVPLSFVSAEAPMYREQQAAGERAAAAAVARGARGGGRVIRSGATQREVLLTHAVSRLMLSGAIDNIQASWVKEGMDRLSDLISHCGVNDVGGTLMNESISTSAGSAHGQMMRPSTLRRCIRGAGRRPIERSTCYITLREAFPEDEDGLMGSGGGDRSSLGGWQLVAAGRQTQLEQFDESSAETARVFGSFGELIKSDEHRYRAQFGGGRRRRRRLQQQQQRPAQQQPRQSQDQAFSLGTDQAPLPGLHAAAAPAEGGSTSLPAVTPGSFRTRTVSYSPSYTIVPTFECFNVCTYCNFRTDVTGHTSNWLSLEAADVLLREIAAAGQVSEILVLSGEVHPEHRLRRAWLQRCRDLCELALQHGLLPHANVGPLSAAEMSAMAEVNVSMGLMLESSSPRLMEAGQVHRHAPSKRPEHRYQQLVQAGELGIPFTTGLLLGIGESDADRVDSLTQIAELSSKYGHIAECILQPFSPGTAKQQSESGDGNSDTAGQHSSRQARQLRRRQQQLPAAGFPLERMAEMVELARSVLPTDVVIQVPPNLLRQQAAAGGRGGESVLRACLDAGARDLGGMSPKDEVNPDYGFPTVDQLRQQLGQWGYSLQSRLPVHERHMLDVPHEAQPALSQWLARATSCEGGG